MVNESEVFIIKQLECVVDILVNVFVIIAIKCSQCVMDMMMNGFVTVSITMNVSRRQPLHKLLVHANNVAMLRRQQMHRSHSHLLPSHPCIC